MKSNYLIKIIPFLSTFTLIAILNFSNQKVNTKLKILIWNTPSLSLGSYLAISTGTGCPDQWRWSPETARSVRCAMGGSLPLELRRSPKPTPKSCPPR